MKFKIRRNAPYLLRESARTWNRVMELREQFGENPTPEQQEELERAALIWFEASARAGNAARARG